MKELIESGILEEYVMGTLPAKEAGEVARLCAAHPELAAEVEAIENALLQSLSRPVPEEWKSEILAAATSPEPEKEAEPQVIPLHTAAQSNKRPFRWSWAAASFAGLFVLSAAANYFLFSQNRRLTDELTETKVKLIRETDDNRVLMAGLKQTQDDYRQLFGRDFSRIDMAGTPGFADQHSVLFWNAKTGAVIWDGSSLPVLPAENRYQLWAIVDGKPQNAGLLPASGPGKMVDAFSAQAFAVTIEPRGGSESPTLDKMVVFAPVKTPGDRS